MGPERMANGVLAEHRSRSPDRRSAAGGIHQLLRAGLVDEMHLAISPVLLGSGERLRSGLDGARAPHDAPTCTCASAASFHGGRFSPASLRAASYAARASRIENSRRSRGHRATSFWNRSTSSAKSALVASS